MARVIVDGREIEIAEHERLNGIQAAERAGVQIPHYCWHPGLSVVGSCRMCLVEVGTRDAKTGRVTMLPRPVPACNTPAKDGTVFVTNSERVERIRAMVEEDLLLRHPIDCPICDKAGECRLQDYHFRYGQDERRADIRPFSSRRRDLGPTISLFVDRCVMCSRCVRFTRQISGTGELLISGRGSHEEIDVLPGFPLANNLSGNVVDLCPVGALADKDFLYRQRVWFMRSRPALCTGCATGCSIWVDENQDRVWRLRPRENPHVNQWWMCNEGRYGYPHVHSPERLTAARRRPGWPNRQSGPGELLDAGELIRELGERLSHAGHLAAVLSPHLTVEEAFLLAQLVRRFDPQAVIAMGHVPVVGEDEKFPNGFTIRAEKCPNRRGVEEIVRHFMGTAVGWEDFVAGLRRDRIRGVWVSGGYRSSWVDQTVAEQFDSAELLVVQDLFPSPLSARADYELPSAAFPEREGAYVNAQERLQPVGRAIRPPSGIRVEGGLLWELLGRPGLYQPRLVLDELSAAIPYFRPAAMAVPDVGLEMNWQCSPPPSKTR
jgi:NADH-quinone oxidoreductase subunit G